VHIKEKLSEINIGEAEKISSGNDIALLAVGNMVEYAKIASAALLMEGIHCEIINMRFVKPLDTNMLDDISSRFDKIITLEENTLVGGFGTGVVEYFSDKKYKNEILRIGLPDQFIDHGTQKELHKILEIDPEGIVKKVRELLSKNINNGSIA
jgi:1-deoxy-D-xylulose-5-phosphate synthase